MHRKNTDSRKNKKTAMVTEITDAQASQVRGGTGTYQILSAGGDQSSSIDVETKKLTRMITKR